MEVKGCGGVPPAVIPSPRSAAMGGRASALPLDGGKRVGLGEARDEERSVAAAERAPGAKKAPLVEGAEVLAASDHRGVVEGIIRAASGGKAPAGGSCAAEAGQLPRGTVDTDDRMTEPEGVRRCGVVPVKSSEGAPERGRSGR